MRKILYTIVITLASAPLFGQIHAELETGLAFNTYNELRFPNGTNSTADALTITNELGKSNTYFYRLRAGYTINKKHTISALYAPLTFDYSGSFSRDYTIGENTFLANTPIDARYRFNSYRITYRYEWFNEGAWHFGIGLTGKVRDARIAVNSGNKNSETTDLGFVPLINFRLMYYNQSSIIGLFEGDALVGTQGRAEDVFLGILYRFNPKTYLKLGYRVLEGGADVDQVLNFSLIHYASVGLRVQL